MSSRPNPRVQADWTPVAKTPPPAKTLVDVITEGGDQRTLFYDGLWWLPDRSMYCYFVPAFWRPASTDESAS